jgi:acyl-CoA synthetase (AMP-forming)/AMP-acid ligase II
MHQPQQFHFQSMTEMVEVRAKETPDKEIVSVPDKQFKFTSYTYKDINEGADRLAHYYHDQEGLEVRKVGDVDTRLNTTIIAPSAIDYAIHELAFAKMGLSKSLFSPEWTH